MYIFWVTSLIQCKNIAFSPVSLTSKYSGKEASIGKPKDFAKAQEDIKHIKF